MGARIGNSILRDYEEAEQEAQLAMIKRKVKRPDDIEPNARFKKWRRMDYLRRTARYHRRREESTLAVIRHHTERQRRETETAMSQIMVREIMDLLPLTVKDEVFHKLLDGSWPEILAAAELVKQHLPRIIEE